MPVLSENCGALRIFKPNPIARVRLFCFPHAGAGAGVFFNWPQRLPDWVEVCAFDLPGRGRRIREMPLRRIEDAAGHLADYLDAPSPAKPFCFFGHSMGALVAFELCRLLRARGRILPSTLFVSGRRAPQLPRWEAPTYHLPDAELIEKLRVLDGTPQEILDDAETISLLLPAIRADLHSVQTYKYRHEPALSCSIFCFGGRDDRSNPEFELEGWREHTCVDFEVTMLPGGHFFPQENEALLLRFVTAGLSQSVC